MIIQNKAKCLLCGDVIESKDTHDHKWCSCGSLAVDGGHDYIRRSFRTEDCFEELSEIIDDSPPSGTNNSFFNNN